MHAIGDAFPFGHQYVKANFVVGEGELFTEYQHPEDYEDEEDFPDGPPPPDPGSPVVTLLGKDKSVSYFGFVNPLDVSYGSILLKLCYARLQSSYDKTGQPNTAKKAPQQKLKKDNYAAVTLSFDGACKDNPSGKAGCGWTLISDSDQSKIAEGRRYLGSSGYTNNVAEYFGLIEGLKYIRSSGIEIGILRVKGDSQLVLNQIDGSYKVRNARLRPLRSRANDMLSRHGGYILEHVERDENKDADRLANEAIALESDCVHEYWR
jgi:ribonuclease HI